MPASYANRLNCKWRGAQPLSALAAFALFISFGAISLAAGEAVEPVQTPKNPTLTVEPRAADDSNKTGAGPAAPVTPPGTPPTSTPATPAQADFPFEQFAAADGVYVLNTRTGTVQAVAAQGQNCSFPFAGMETVAVETLTVPGRFRGSLVQNALFVLDRQTGVLEKVVLSSLTRTVVLGAGAQPGSTATVAGGTTNNGNTGAGTVTGAGHLPPPPQYAAVQVPAQVTDADRTRAERNIEDYSAFLGYPYLGAPLKDGYQLEVRIANRGKRALAALEVTLEYRDPKEGTPAQQRYYFRRDNGDTNAPPGPGQERMLTLQLPAFAEMPAFKIYTSYLVFAD